MPKRDKSPTGRPKPAVVQRAQLTSVWEVFEGEDYEGGNSWAVFSNKDSAVLCAKARLQERGHPTKDWVEEEPNEWHCGCNYIEVREHIVWPSYDEFKADLHKQIEESKAKRALE
jgi:hypothetical protein